MNSIINKNFLIKLALFIILFLDGFGQSLIFPILTKTILSTENRSLVNDLSTYNREIIYGFIVGLFYFFWMFGTAILGDLSDSYGRKKGLIICILGMIIGNILTVLAFATYHVWLVILGRSIIGFTAGSQAIAQASIADMSTAENQARNTGLIILAVTLGAILGPIYGQLFSDSQLCSLFNNQTPFIGVILLSLLSFFILLLFYHDTSKPNNKAIQLTRVITIFKDAFIQPTIRVLLLSMISIFGCWAIYYTYMTIYLVKMFDASGGQISIYMSMYGVGASVAMAILSSFVEKKFTTKQAVIAGWTLLAFSMLLTQLSSSLILDYILAIFAGIGVAIGILFSMKIFSLQVSADRQGWIMGVFNASWVGMMGITVMLMGYIANFGLIVPLLIGYMLYFIGIILFIRKA